MRIHRSWILTVLSFVGAAASTGALRAQTGPAAPPMSMMAPAYGAGPVGQPPGPYPSMQPPMGMQAPMGMQPGFSPGPYGPGPQFGPQFGPPAGPRFGPPMGPQRGPRVPNSPFSPYGPGNMSGVQQASFSGPTVTRAMGPPPEAPFPGMQAGAMSPMGPGAMGPMGPGQMGPMGPGAMGPMGPGQMGPMGPGQMGPMGPGQMGPMGPGQMGPMGPGAMGPGAMGPMGPGGPPPGACGACGGMGCQSCSQQGRLGGGQYGHDNLHLGGLLKYLLPYGEGGCCPQRWFDAYAEAVFMTRDTVSRYQPFTSDGPAGFGPPLIVLSTNDLDFNEREGGFRIRTAVHMGPGGSVEFGYMGTFNWASSASVESDLNELFSVFSDFGSDPFLGFNDTDGSSFQGIEYSSSFDTFELDFRHRWVGPNCRLQGSWLMGVRYFSLDEDFRYLTQNTQDPPDGPGFMDYLVGTKNAMTGFQLGGDLWLCLIPGLRFGGEVKAGIYGNHASQKTSIALSELNAPLYESESSDDVALLSEGYLGFTWRLNYHWTLRGGYRLLYVDGVALAPENFDGTMPLVNGDDRIPFVNDNGNVFYHGFSGGLEWMW